MSNLFRSKAADAVPLAARMAPSRLGEFAGQDHILAEEKLLRRAVESDRLSSALFYGPSGSGKTVLAKIVALRSRAEIFEINAASSSTVELKEIIACGRKLRAPLSGNGKKVLVLLDEIHHFNRTQQDVLLPSVEKGEIILIGLTTENPFYYVNSALLSRFLIFEFKPLSREDLGKILENALGSERGLKKYNPVVDEEAKNYFVENADGDARKLLNALEIAVITTPPAGGRVKVNLKTAVDSMQKRILKYDKSSDEHYDHISAFIKSMRGSDPDAAVYWMAKMLKAGEDPRFIARRILICAAEDVGNANPMALLVAQSAFNAVEALGMPEARIPLSQAAIYVAVSPKSNACYAAINSAMAEVEKGRARAVPLHLKDPGRDADAFGHGKGYEYPHDYENHHVAQEYMPDPVEFYRPSQEGFEIKISERMKRLGSHGRK